MKIFPNFFKLYISGILLIMFLNYFPLILINQNFSQKSLNKKLALIRIILNYNQKIFENLFQWKIILFKLKIFVTIFVTILWKLWGFCDQRKFKIEKLDFFLNWSCVINIAQLSEKMKIFFSIYLFWCDG